MTKRELEEKIIFLKNDFLNENAECARLQNQYENSRRNYLRQITKLKITNKKLREKLKEVSVGALTKNS